MRTLGAHALPALLSTLLVAGQLTGGPAGAVAPPVMAAASVGGDEARDWFVKRVETIGSSRRDRPIRAWYRGDREADHVLVVLGQMHGDEKAGRRTAQWVRANVRPRRGTGVWVVPTMNPDGNRRGTRQNARGVDLNRNWPTSGWSRGPRGSRYWGGPRPASEPETRAMMRFLRRVRPAYVASIHQPLHAVGKGGGDLPWQRRLARELALPLRHLGVGNPSGTVSPTLTGWYNARHRGVATTIEYGYHPSRRYVTVKAGRGICRAARVL
ncbi:M14 family zinc carboxypeptidase [Nocardioides sp. TF02-7]|uniref:M14 family zinc carboxypeptidase n=1 Tax=Nocardioides sp. TF02-7 TaxID=2917724 RepID=UPI001F0509D1|nr:M14 family zinc carboxypeptidase [Nocardioides sp. TF02-7]UMG94008.1 DUF2817 domain-containing protein [Nocardioides sp. TF02-7]